MKVLQARYSALQVVNFFATCAVCVFATVFLQSRGLSNTEVGVVTAGGCMLSVVFGPVLSRAISRSVRLTIERVLVAGFGAMGVAFLALVALQVPKLLLMAAYATIYAGLMTTPPLLSQMCMDYLRVGQAIDFGMARGLGSVSYAVSAALFGQLASRCDPVVLAPIFALSCVAMIWLLRTMPSYGEGARAERGVPVDYSASDVPAAPRTGIGMGAFLLKYRLLALVLIGFGFLFSASACLSTYLINIVSRLGGDASLYGVGIFWMAMTELPAMMAVPALRRRFGTGALLAIAGIAFLLRNILIALAPSLPVLFTGLTLQGLSYGTLSALLAHYVSETCDQADEMMGQTLIAVMTSGIGATLGNFMGGVLQDAWGIGAMAAFAVVASVFGSMMLVVAGAQEKRSTSMRPMWLRAR